MEIGQEGKGEAAELLGERLMGMFTVDADAQDLGIRRFEARVVALERGELVLSGSGEI